MADRWVGPADLHVRSVASAHLPSGEASPAADSPAPRVPQTHPTERCMQRIAYPRKTPATGLPDNRWLGASQYACTRRLLKDVGDGYGLRTPARRSNRSTATHPHPSTECERPRLTRLQLPRLIGVKAKPGI